MKKVHSLFIDKIVSISANAMICILRKKYFLLSSLRFAFFFQDKIFYDHVVQPVLREDNEIGVRSLSEHEDKIKGSFSLMSLFDSITYNKVKHCKILPVSCTF